MDQLSSLAELALISQLPTTKQASWLASHPAAQRPVGLSKMLYPTQLAFKI
jgi:hypothetical protein